MSLKRKHPKVTGKDAERFKLRKRINEIKLEIKLLQAELYQLEDELEVLNNKRE